VRRLFVETGIFTKTLKEKGEKDLLEIIQTKILENPQAGDVMPGCGGVRKMRIADPSRGKGSRGGLRVLFFDLPHREITYLIYLYGKNEAENISANGKKRIRELASALREE
jgi:hypothetical protein